MRSFSLLTLAAAALAPFVAAAPAPVDVVARSPALAVPEVPAVPVSGSSVKAVENKLDVRGGQKGLAAIFLDVKVGISVDIESLNCLTAQNATTEVITPILKDIVSVIGSAVVEVKALVGADLSVILAPVEGTAELAVSEVAQLLAEILILIFGALGFVLKIVSDVTVVVNALVSVAFGACLCEFLSAVFALVDDLLAALIPLVLSLAGVIVELGLGAVGQLLTIC